MEFIPNFSNEHLKPICDQIIQDWISTPNFKSYINPNPKKGKKRNFLFTYAKISSNIIKKNEELWHLMLNDLKGTTGRDLIKEKNIFFISIAYIIQYLNSFKFPFFSDNEKRNLYRKIRDLPFIENIGGKQISGHLWNKLLPKKNVQEKFFIFLYLESISVIYKHQQPYYKIYYLIEKSIRKSIGMIKEELKIRDDYLKHSEEEIKLKSEQECLITYAKLIFTLSEIDFDLAEALKTCKLSKKYTGFLSNTSYTILIPPKEAKIISELKKKKNILIEYLQYCSKEFKIKSIDYKIENFETPFIIPITGKKYLEINTVPDDFYLIMLKKINILIANDFNIASMILIRKFFENMLIDLLRKKFGPKEIELYYDPSQGRHLMLNRLISNFKLKQLDFHSYSPEITKDFIESIKLYQQTGNESAHSLTVDPQKLKDFLLDHKTEINHIIKVLIRLENQV
jgi:hypothetical protein